VVLLVLVAIAVVFGVLQLSARSRSSGRRGSNPAPAPNPTVSQVALHAGGTLKPNPPAGDPYEHQDQVPLAFDGNPSTSWSTQWYPNPVFGGLRDAVGIYGMPASGGAQAHRGRHCPPGLDGRDQDLGRRPELEHSRALAAVGSQQNFDVSALGSHRYWMVWITNLVSGPNGYQASIAEIKAFH